MARGAIFQYPSLVHISVKIRRQNHSGTHFGSLRAIEAGPLIIALHVQPIRLSLSRVRDAVRDSNFKLVR
jgi:hypothetical protein